MKVEGYKILRPAHMQINGRALKKVDPVSLLLLFLPLDQALRIARITTFSDCTLQIPDQS